MKKDRKSKKPENFPLPTGRGGKRPGAGRPSLAPETAKLQVVVSASLAERLVQQAARAGVTIADHLRDILARAVQ